jgi:signal transduction histidine kinase
VFERDAHAPVFWRGRAKAAELVALVGRFVGIDKARKLFDDLGPRRDAELVQFAETQLAGAIGSASARVMVASVVEEEALEVQDVMRIVDEARALRDVNAQLKALDRLKDDFMSSVTHELRTPLTSIRALAELMRDEPDMPAAQRAQFLGIVVAESERLSRLVNQVLDLAKIESGSADWRPSDIDLPVLLRQAAQTTGELFRERGTALDVELPAAAPVLRADADRLQQVLLNLLGNAVKFSRGRVKLALRCEPRQAVVTVDDDGPGVPPGEREQIFEKFRQGGPADARPAGTGLGLPIARQIVEHFGGRLWLEDSPLGGARFAFALPWNTTTTETTP